MTFARSNFVNPESLGQVNLQNMRALFIVQYPKLAPSPRYRVFQMIPQLESLGLECDVVSLLTEKQFLQSRKPGQWLWKSAIMSGAYLRRQQLVRRAKDYDLVYVLKGAFPYGPPIFERRIRKAGVPLVFDFDDAIYIPKRSVHHGIVDRFRASRYLPEVVGLANRVVVPNAFLAEFSSRYNLSVTIVPEAEDVERLTPRPSHRNEEELVIGWVGSPSTVKYLKLVEPALREICRRYPHVVLRVIGGKFVADGIRVENVPWSLDREVAQFHGLDIGIMPLPLEEWSKGKSGCKLRQYMAAGVPGVATRIGYNCELVEDGETGLLVETQEEWIAALSDLIESAETRNRLAENARRSVVERFSIEKIGSQLYDVLVDVANDSDKPQSGRRQRDVGVSDGISVS